MRYHRVLGQGLSQHHEAVVLRGDLDPPGGEVLNRLINSVMSELELGCPAPDGQTQELVSQTDAEDGLPAQERADGLDGVGNGLGIARTIREHDAVRLQRQDIFGRGT